MREVGVIILDQNRSRGEGVRAVLAALGQSRVRLLEQCEEVLASLAEAKTDLVLSSTENGIEKCLMNMQDLRRFGPAPALAFFGAPGEVWRLEEQCLRESIRYLGFLSDPCDRQRLARLCEQMQPMAAMRGAAVIGSAEGVANV